MPVYSHRLDKYAFIRYNWFDDHAEERKYLRYLEVIEGHEYKRLDDDEQGKYFRHLEIIEDDEYKRLEFLSLRTKKYGAKFTYDRIFSHFQGLEDGVWEESTDDDNTNILSAGSYDYLWIHSTPFGKNCLFRTIYSQRVETKYNSSMNPTYKDSKRR